MQHCKVLSRSSVFLISLTLFTLLQTYMIPSTGNRSIYFCFSVVVLKVARSHNTAGIYIMISFCCGAQTPLPGATRPLTGCVPTLIRGDPLGRIIKKYNGYMRPCGYRWISVESFMTTPQLTAACIAHVTDTHTCCL